MNNTQTDKRQMGKYVLFFRWDELPVLSFSDYDDLMFRWEK
jgi:hypothetical protein